MKAPAFWCDEKGVWGTLLQPFTLIWRAGTLARRVFANPYRAKIPLICVGNIVAGGAGKTPAAIMLAKLLQHAGHKPAFVTRGYGGRFRMAVCVDPRHHTARDVGDEALLLARIAPTFIGRDRVQAIKLAEVEATHIIMDDGLQNPNIAPDKALLVVDAAYGFGNGRIIPAGPLRETLAGALKKVQAVLILGQGDEVTENYFGATPVVRGEIVAELPADFPRTKPILAFAGIGMPEKFFATCRALGLNVAATESFPDHHRFTSGDMARLWDKAAQQGADLLTTEKDWVRLPPSDQARIKALPITLKLGAEAEDGLRRIILPL